MAKAETAKYQHLILEVEFDPVGDAGNYSIICGMIDVSVTRTSNIDTTEVPDCTDESLPLSVERSVRSQEVSASGTGVWALSSNSKISDWWYSGATLLARLRNAKVEADGVTGDIITETGPAILVSLNNSRTKGQKVTAEIELQWDGVPVRGLKP